MTKKKVNKNETEREVLVERSLQEVAQITIENNLALLHNDRDFEAISAVVTLKFCTLE